MEGNPLRVYVTGITVRESLGSVLYLRPVSGPYAASATGGNSLKMMSSSLRANRHIFAMSSRRTVSSSAGGWQDAAGEVQNQRVRGDSPAAHAGRVSDKLLAEPVLELLGDLAIQPAVAMHYEFFRQQDRRPVHRI